MSARHAASHTETGHATLERNSYNNKYNNIHPKCRTLSSNSSSSDSSNSNATSSEMNVTNNNDGEDYNDVVNAPYVLQFLTQKYGGWISEHVQHFEEKMHNTVKVEIVMVDTFDELYSDIINEANSEIGLYDGFITPPIVVGSVMENYGWADLTPFINEDFARIKDWTDIKLVYREHISYYQKSQTIMYPLDGDLLNLYYRKDILQHFNISGPPRTWDEYSTIAAQVHNQTYYDPIDNTTKTLIGSCVSWSGCADEYWSNLLIGSITQTHGMATGHLIDSKDFQFLLTQYPVMEQVLQWLEQQVIHGADNAFEYCTGKVNQNKMIEEGNCVLTYNWGENFRQYLTGNSTLQGKLGIAPTPGSLLVLDRETMQLTKCNDTIGCPSGQTYADIGRVNSAPYLAFGGWSCSVNNYTTSSLKRLAMEFCAFASSSAESMDMIIPNATDIEETSAGRDPYRSSQLSSSVVDLYVAKGYERTTTEEYLAAINYDLDSSNAMSDLRIPTSSDLYKVLNEEFHNYLVDVKNFTIVPDSSLRRGVADRINSRWKQIMDQYNSAASTRHTLMETYQKVLNVYEPQQDLNQINRVVPFGYTAYGIIIFSVIACIIWTARYRTSAVIRASQPTFLVLICLGVLIFGAAIIPLGFDDSNHDLDACSAACMATWWLVTIGWTTTFSALYAKLRRVNLVFNHSSRMKRVTVSEKEVFRIFVVMFVLNLIILLIWNIVDPLKWERQQTSETSSYGRCVISGDMSSVSFGCLLAVSLINLLALVLANYEAFKARKISTEYSESEFIGRTMTSLFQLVLIGLPTMFLVIDNPTAAYFIKCSMIFLSSMTILCFIFVPKILAWMKNPGDRRADSVRISGVEIDYSSDFFQKFVTSLAKKLGVLNEIMETEGIDGKALFRKAGIDFDNLLENLGGGRIAAFSSFCSPNAEGDESTFSNVRNTNDKVTAETENQNQKSDELETTGDETGKKAH